jgi:hypothetical protein
MKTPREILLARHRVAEPKLDAIRRAVVHDLNHKDAKAQSWANGFVSFFLHFLNTPWRELVLSSRRVWIGLAAVWGLILIVNVSQRDTVSGVTGKPVNSPAMVMSWQEQQRLMNEVLADRTVPPEADRPKKTAPKPRTEKIETTAV